MTVFKVVARCPKTKRQKIKKIYESDSKYEKYGEITAKRYQAYHDVEIYAMYHDSVYFLVNNLQMPRTKEELEKYAEETNSGDKWVEYRLKQLGDEFTM